MRQVCNLVYAVNAEIKTEPGEFERWELDIMRPPASYFNRRGYRMRSYVSPELDRLMGG